MDKTESTGAEIRGKNAMSFKGSVVIKRIHLLNMIQNQKSIFRSDISKASKRVVWGQEMAYNIILDEDISEHDWDIFMQSIFDIYPIRMKEGIDLVFQTSEGSAE